MRESVGENEDVLSFEFCQKSPILDNERIK